MAIPEALIVKDDGHGICNHMLDRETRTANGHFFWEYVPSPNPIIRVRSKDRNVQDKQLTLFNEKSIIGPYVVTVESRIKSAKTCRVRLFFDANNSWKDRTIELSVHIKLTCIFPLEGHTNIRHTASVEERFQHRIGPKVVELPVSWEFHPVSPGDSYRMTFEVNVRTVKDESGVVVDVTKPQPGYSDVALNVGTSQFYGNKWALGLVSPYLRKLFSDNRSVYNINGISSTDLHMFLSYLCPMQERIDESTIESLMSAAERLQVHELKRRCVVYLSTSNNLNFAMRLFLADKYDLFELLDICINMATNEKELKDLVKNSSYFRLLNGTTKSRLLNA